MPSGFRLDTDLWVKDYEAASVQAQEVVQIIQERNLNFPDGGPEASRRTAAARRKMGTLGTEIERLFQWLDSSQAAALSEQERFRRRDLLHALKNRREQILHSLKRTANSQERESLLAGGSKRVVGQETEATAQLDNRGLLQLQENAMRQQDDDLVHLEKAVISTKHIALTIGEEVDLHTRLLEELEEDVDVTESRMRAATKRIQQVIKRSSSWKLGLCMFFLIVVFVVVVLLALKLIKLFA